MGFAIIIIVFYHFFNNGGGTLIDKALRICFSQGYIGVDLFMVVSGLGLTFSMNKSENLKEYYLKRWVRIFPFFTFITIIECWLISGEDFGLALLRSTTIGYWIGVPYIDWYVPAIVGLYCIYPILYFNIVKPGRYKQALTLCILTLVVSIVLNYFPLLDWKHYALLYRIPDFVMGSMMGIAIIRGYQPVYVKRFVSISSLAGIVLLVATRGYNHGVWLFQLCLTPLYLYLLCHLFDALSSSIFKVSRMLPQVLAFFGVFTLELYRVSSSFERLLTSEVCPKYHSLFVLLYFILSAILAYICSILFKYINDYLYRKLKSII